MSYIGFMRNTVNHIEKLFNKYLQNTKIYPSSLEKKITKTLFSRWSVFTDMEKWKTRKNTKSS